MSKDFYDFEFHFMNRDQKIKALYKGYYINEKDFDDLNIKIFDGVGNLNLFNIKKLKSDLIFNNIGDVNLGQLEELPLTIKFNNKGGLYLHRLNVIPSHNVVIANKGNLYIPNKFEKYIETGYIKIGNFTIPKYY